MLLGQIMSFKVTDTKLKFETQKSKVSLAFPSALEKRPMNSKFCMCMIGFEILCSNQFYGNKTPSKKRAFTESINYLPNLQLPFRNRK